MDVVGEIEDTTSVRPDFMILGYPVVSMQDKFTHAYSRKLLLGDEPSTEEKNRFSNELRVTAQTPPTFIVHSTDDGAVPVENSVQLYLAMREQNIPVEMHLYEYGGHGYGMAKGNGHLGQWSEQLAAWLQRLFLESE
jgi:dipeptidyl aminopeptidase/acylaminoacyl peptidase